MEDEQGDVGPGSSGGISELPLSDDLPSETVVENMGGENQVEESFEEGDGGEIMVEVVGSDVFVDGIGGRKDGDLGSGEVGDLEGHVNVSEAMDVLSEGGGDKKGESDVGFSGSRGEQNDVVTNKENVDVGVTNKENVDDEVWNPGIEAMDVSTSEVVESMAGKAEQGLVTSEDKMIKDEAVVKDSVIVTPEPLSCPLEATVEEKVAIVEEKGTIVEDKVAIVEEKGVIVEEIVAIVEEKGAIVEEKGTIVEEKGVIVEEKGADLEEKVAIAEKEEILPSSDNAESHDHLVADSMMTADGGQVVPSEGPDNVHVDGIDSLVGEVGLVNASAGGEVLATGSPKNEANAESASPHGDGVEAELVDEKEVLDAESKGSILISGAQVSNVQIENQSCLNEFQSVEAVLEEKVGIIEKGEILPSSDTAASHDDLGANSVTSREATNAADGGNAVSTSAGGVEAKSDDGNKVLAAESNKTDALVSDVQGEATYGIDGVSHARGMEIDHVMDLKEQDSDINMPDSGGVSNDECLKIDEELKTDMVHQNHASSSEPTQLLDGGDTAEGKEDNSLDFKIQVDAEENQMNTASSSCPQEEQIVHDEDQTPISKSASEVINDQKVSIPEVEARRGDESREKVEEVDSEILMQSIPALDDASAENAHLPAQGECSMVETTDVTIADHVAANDIIELENVVEECGSPRGNEQEVFVQISETPNRGADKLEGINLMPNEVANVAAISDITPGITEKAELHVDNSMEEVNKSMEAQDCSVKSNGHYIMEDHTSEEKPVEIEEGESDQKYHEDDYEEPELGNEEHSSETDQLKLLNEEPVKYSNRLRMNQSGYFSPPENEGQFAVSDLVWGKVRSHPWWPGQIFDPSDASDKAVKYYKKDAYLVAYFGDRTFAWNDASVLKPFRSHFYQIEKQSNSEAFQNAVTSALEEVSRRVELGLACSCIPKDAYSEIETQIVENAGIREESTRRYGVDQSSKASLFEPDKLLEYVRDLAPRAASGADRLDLVIARAQLSAFYRFKGYRLPAGFPTSGELLENEEDTKKLSDEVGNSHKRKHTPRDSPTSRKKERSLVELMGGDEYLPDVEDESIEKDSITDVSDKRVSVYGAKLSTSMNQTPKPSFKIGERISRVASQLTGATSLVKCQNAETGIDGSSKISAESSSLNEMLLQLQMVAQDPKKGDFLNSTKTFLLGFRSSISLNKRSRKKKVDTTIGGSGEDFEFDDVNDSYWTDRIVQNYAEEQLLHKSENGGNNLQVVTFDAEKSVKSGRRPYSRKRYSTGSFPMEATEFEENIKRRKQESSPAELILNFAERKSVPSEINLNKMFRRFGPLMESETEVDHESGRAKIIFKRGSDAEVAHNSAEKFNIFGPVLVNYQIGYSPLISVKISPLAIPQFQEDVTLMI
ncbi:hypothetical protein BUALT_Bualt06G0014200 [Buddleja alternifolia]|uniref:PWWP domain-containing protein n=1 Tax=Buddleja alternifolia TaxID=168488 RepID=A0AAV6XIK8_9LAMI|nr:hypothetical protein BUALT_Bualt06G0014200 [Buddleja alternifolia]